MQVIDIFTRQEVKQVKQVKRETVVDWLVPVQRLAERLERPMSEVMQSMHKTCKRMDQDHLRVSTYLGNVHTGRHCNPVPLPVNVDEIIEYIKRERIKVVTLTDSCFMYMDRKYKLTQRFLDRLKETEVHSIIMLKMRSDLFAHDSYLERLQGFDVQVSISRVERQGYASLKRRERALNKILGNLRVKAVAL